MRCWAALASRADICVLGKNWHSGACAANHCVGSERSTDNSQIRENSAFCAAACAFSPSSCANLAACKTLAKTDRAAAPRFGAASPTAPRRAEATERPAAAAAAPTPPARPRSSHAERHGLPDGPSGWENIQERDEDVPEPR